MRPTLVVVTGQTPQSPSGVATHFNQILAGAKKRGIETVLVTPHDVVTLEKKLAGAVFRGLRLISREYAEMWSLWTNSRRMKGRLAAELRRLEGRPVTLYAQDPLSASLALEARGDRDCRVVAVVHFNVSVASEAVARGMTKENGRIWLYLMRTERESLPRVDHLIFVSDFMRRVVNERLPAIAAVPQTTIPNFCRMLEADTSDAERMGDLISIGYLEPRKNQAFLLQVLAECNMRGRRYTLSLVGNGPDEQRLKDVASQLGVSGQVQFLGFQPLAARLIPRHRALVHAARMENLCITLIEALSYRRPILAPAVGGNPEVFTDGREGFYWNLSDPVGAADRLIEVLDTPEIWQRMSDLAWKTFVERFCPEVVERRWMELLIGSTS